MVADRLRAGREARAHGMSTTRKGSRQDGDLSQNPVIYLFLQNRRSHSFLQTCKVLKDNVCACDAGGSRS